jgi:hypothetical protein
MTPRTRKLMGTIFLVTFLAVYAFVAMMIAIVLQVNASKIVEFTYYVLAGLLWVIPAAAIVTWMQRMRPGDEQTGTSRKH